MTWWRPVGIKGQIQVTDWTNENKDKNLMTDWTNENKDKNLVDDTVL
jgi:hypothetical protein